MNLRAKITVAAGALLLAGCREMPRYFSGDETVAPEGGSFACVTCGESFRRG